MAEPKSKAEEALLKEVANYVRDVMDRTGWTQVEVAKASGYADHTAINKILRSKHKMGLDALFSLQVMSEVPWPASLQKAVIARRNPTASPRKDSSLPVQSESSGARTRKARAR